MPSSNSFRPTARSWTTRRSMRWHPPRRIGERLAASRAAIDQGTGLKPNTGGFMPQVTSLPETLPVALTTNFDFALPAIVSGAVRFRPEVLLVEVGWMKVCPPDPAEALVV